MRPVVLTVVGGKNFLLGTFDTTIFQSWWKSEPFPGQVEEIKQPVHVYGQYHVCIVRMQDGSYAIYRTKNMGKSWESVYTTSDIIYTLTLIDYGWVIGSTSSGWIESKLDSGKTWSEISSFAPGCKTVINISDDILFAHDGSQVWKSVDNAQTWTSVLSSSGWISESYYGHPSKSYQYIGGNSYPALAGINNYIFVGFGPYLIISDSAGERWHTHWAVDGTPGNISSAYGLVPSFGPKYNSKIMQILISGTDIDPMECSAIALVRLLGSDQIEYWYAGPENHHNYPDDKLATTTFGSVWSKLFTYPYKNDVNGTISSSEVLKPGSSEKELLSVFTTYNNNNVPIVKYSFTSGYTWESMDPTSTIVYEGDPTQEIISDLGQQVFDEEYWVTYTFVGKACHNTGKYLIEYNKTVRGLSWDQDLLISFRKTKTLPNDAVTKILKTKTCAYDILNKRANAKNFVIDILNKGTVYSDYLVSQMLQDTFEQTFDSEIAIAERTLLTYDGTIPIKKLLTHGTYNDVLLFNTVDKTYSMGIKLIDDHVEQIMNSIERYTPQPPDIRYPDIPYKPYDSRTQQVVP